MKNANLKTVDDDNKALNLGLFATHLLDEGYKTIVAGYEGSGDDGGIEYICASKDDFDTVLDEACSWDPHGDDIRDKEGVGIVEDLVDNLTNNIEDWWNNDGGYGIVVINLVTAEYKINNIVRYTQTELYEHEGKL